MQLRGHVHRTKFLPLPLGAIPLVKNIPWACPVGSQDRAPSCRPVASRFLSSSCKPHIAVPSPALCSS